MTFTLWPLAVMLVSVPGTLFSAVKAVPGLVHMDATLMFVLTQSVSLWIGLLTAFGLQKVAMLLSTSTVDRANLLIVAKLLVTVLLPSLVTATCHAECLGGWKLFWKVCTVAEEFARNRVLLDLGSNQGDFTAELQVVDRSELCGMSLHVKPSGCADAVMDRLAQLLYTKTLHHALSFPAVRLLQRRKWSIADACGTLAFAWLGTLMLGPCLPMLHLLSLMLLSTHAALLFGPLRFLQHGEELSLSTAGVSCATLFAALLQLCITYGAA
eukprot:6484656-Amphidinium_carterae.1